MTEREFAIALRQSATRVLAAMDGKPGNPSVPNAWIGAILHAIWAFERYSGASRGIAPIVKPLLRLVFRDRTDARSHLVRLVQAVETTYHVGDEIASDAQRTA